jgi:hypothetical protein
VKSPRRDFSEVDKLIELSIEGAISPEQTQLLNDWIVNDSAIRRHYCEYIYLTVCIERMSVKTPATDLQENNMVFDQELWNKLAQEEKEAPVVEVAACEEPKILIEKVQRQSVNRKISKSSWFSLIAGAAAIILIFVFARFAPKAGIEVATLADSMNAKWADTYASISNGTRFATGNIVFLREGLAQLLFDNETRVTLEGPAEFQILMGDHIKLNYGRLYATVPQGAIGFTVNTSSARIIDLGTEFGIETDGHGDTVLHVIKGKTMLIAGEKSNKVSMEVAQGIAKKVSAFTSAISDIPCNSGKFARSINSSKQITWRGEPLDLASIIAGENGFVPALTPITLNPNTGEYETKPLVSKAYTTNSSYNRVLGNVFIDGVFVPDGTNGPVTITSGGHRFSCPSTSGKFNRNIAVFYKPSNKASSDMQAALFDGIIYGSEKQPCVLLHSNIGITIDLDRIRQAYPGQKIEQLQTGYGLTWAEKNGKADFFILVDGILRHEDKALISQEKSQSVSIKLEPAARFLTFIVTDNQKSSKSPDEAYELDFFYLLVPQLVLR